MSAVSPEEIRYGLVSCENRLSSLTIPASSQEYDLIKVDEAIREITRLIGVQKHLLKGMQCR